ncbi:unnamed protein product [Paramecium sonneborni]|uniref:Uncharacterized protein n=1 Tax=Paramecium sonneborni TaxID=65129 RepID=A0A8S1N061_9CILI|nr:unnamed protein product [Paramecium sonneborni]
MDNMLQKVAFIEEELIIYIWVRQCNIYIDSDKQIASRKLLRCAISNFINVIGQHKHRQYLG